MLFIDIVGSTSLAERLDPEALRLVIDEYFVGCSAAVAEHGGRVEKFIGDAVLAVFGTAVSNEDDAVRAVRAGLDAFAALHGINAGLAASHLETLQARAGICTGEVMVLTTASGDFRVVGDAVNTASRLQNAAAPGEILIDAVTASVARGQVGVEAIAPLILKGKAEPVPAWRVTGLPGADLSQPEPDATPMIGRDDELEQIRQICSRSVARRQMCLVTLIGPPGIGKSRLIREFVAGLDRQLADPPVTVLTGRCSHYGKDITYKPLADVLRSYAGGWPALSELIISADIERGTWAVARLATICPRPGADATGPAASATYDQQAGVEELAWAARTTVEIIGERGPVVIIWDDLHRATDTLLDLIDDIATWLTDVPVLQICVARPELLEARPTWGGGKPCATTIDLAPLTDIQCAELVSALAGGGEVVAHQDEEILARVVAQCDGNPLFAELMLDVMAEVVPGAVIPPTIGAMLSARLDQLPTAERQTLERAAVIGREFSARPLSALAKHDGDSAQDSSDCVARLIRRRLVQRAGQTGVYRFGQALLRDIAYACTPKARREQWHQVLADWLSDHSGGENEDEIGDLALAYHVEAACLLRRELRPGDSSLPRQAARAASVLIAEGERALTRKDLPAAVGLLERGRNLLSAGDPRHERTALLIADACVGLWDADRGLAALAAAEAAQAGDRGAELTTEVAGLIVSLRLRRSDPELIRVRAEQIARELGGLDSADLGWCRLGQLRAYLAFAAERAGDATDALRAALDKARSLGDPYEEERILCAICELAQWSPEPVSQGLALCDELGRRFAGNRALLVPVLLTRGRLSALAGDLAGARDLLAGVLRHASELHLDVAQAATMEVTGFVETLAGAHEKALSRYREAVSALLASDQVTDAQTLRAAAARSLFELGRPAEAAAELDRAEASGDLDTRTQILVLALRGRLAASQVDAAAVARRAAALADQTQDLLLQGEACLDLAAVLRRAGRPADAVAAARRARERFEAKGAALRTAHASDLIATLGIDGAGSAR